jgi:hypothetical protein
MIEVELPGGKIAEFPDGTPREVMTKAVQQYAVKSEAKAKLAGMSNFRKSLYGAERALDEPAMGLKQLVPEALGGGLSQQDKHDLAVRREMEDQIPGSWKARLAGDAAMMFVPGKNIATAAKFLPKALQYGTAMLTGAGQAALNPVLEGESRGRNAAVGAAFGAGGQAVGDVAGRAISGIVPKSTAAAALPQNVQDAATLGQVADRSSTMGRITAALEEKLKSVPVIGSVIEGARDRGTKAWRSNAIAQGTPDGFTPSTGPGVSTRDQLGEIYSEFQNRYTNALKNHQVTPSQMFESQLLKMTADPKNGLSQEMADNLSKDILRNYQARFSATMPNRGPVGTAVGPVGNPGTNIAMGGDEAKGFEAFLSGRARQYAKGQGPLDPDVARFYNNAERAWSAAYKRQLGPQVRAQIRPLDEKYAPYKTLERAAASVQATDGDFTPSQLTNAVAARTGKARFGRGEGMLADEAQQGKAVFMDKVPNSGTADRMMTTGALGAFMVDPISTTGTGLALASTLPAFTTKTGKNLFTGSTKAQKMLQALRMHEHLRSMGIPAGALANDAATQESTRY